MHQQWFHFPFVVKHTPPQDILTCQDDLLKEGGVDWIAVYNEWKFSFKKGYVGIKKGHRMSPEFEMPHCTKQKIK